MIKEMAGHVASIIHPQCRYERAVFILGHMRCGSTALSNVLCHHREISGYGEAHIRYDGSGALGVLSLNQLRRKALRPQARYLFDKILHSRYDQSPGPGFYDARAIFLLREPVATILSIRNLFRAIGSNEYATDALAADYYEGRLEALLESWDRFPPERRIGFTHGMLIGDPDRVLASISALLKLSEPLANRYVPRQVTETHGAGDPLESHRFSGIVPAGLSKPPSTAARPLDLPVARVARLEQLFCAAHRTVTQP